MYTDAEQIRTHADDVADSRPIKQLNDRELELVQTTWWLASHRPTAGPRGHAAAAEKRMTPATPLDALPELLKPSELQQYLGIGRSAAYDFARRHGVKVGRMVRVPKSALSALPAARDI